MKFSRFFSSKRLVPTVAGAVGLTTTASSSTTNAPTKTQYHPCVVIGAGWAGIGVAASLSVHNVDYLS